LNFHTGLAHFWAQSDAVIHATALILLLLSVASWWIIATRALEIRRAQRAAQRAVAAFWEEKTLQSALDALVREDRSGAFVTVAQAGLAAAQAHQRRGNQSIGAGLDPADYIAQALRQGITEAQGRLESGLSFLASVGATAPFIGLFGTVWGIYHALVGLAGATQVVLEKVAGPVGEALIMTAAGLFVAIPAVLAFNACVRANRLLLARLDAFAYALHGYLVGGIRPKGASGDVEPAAPHKTRSAA